MSTTKVELWGGVECTCVRIGDHYRNQIVETGHMARPGDLELVAGLGIRTLRYPVLWEAVAPDDPDVCDWSWSDARLQRLRELGLNVIAGLVHHGSGPRYTSLLDPDFPDKLSAYAAKAAKRYPWISMFTPVNEPLTTARFSGLYGHWYPHAREEGAFLRALVNQCCATALAMRAIRKFNPHAQLVQTEDLGKIFCTKGLAYQADYENERRWLSFDLLLGRVDRSHPFHRRLLDSGVSEDSLSLLRDGEGAPDILGINHYATSDRYLDHAAENYPACFTGGNDHERYADVEALRVDLPIGELGAKARLAEAWARYRRPLAITEAHHGSTRDEQVRWLVELWRDACELRDEGADIRAVTIWSLFGAVDWNSLLVRRNGFYEPGAFDVRSGAPRRTALGRVAAGLAKSGGVDDPVLDQPGWWHRDTRFYERRSRGPAPEPSRRPLLVVGATGTLGRALSRICELRGLNNVILGRAHLDITDAQSIERVVARHKPWAIVNAAGYVRVGDAAREPEVCFGGNVTGAVNLANVCARLGLQYVTFSSDLVFDGALGRAYVEKDAPRPICVYGMSKAEAERQVTAIYADALVVRTSAFFGPWDRANFVWQTLQRLSEGLELDPDDSVVSPTYVPDLANATLDLLIDREAGLWHLANEGMTSWRELAERAARQAGLSWTPARDDAARPVRTTALSSERGVILPKLDDALNRFFMECEVDWARRA